MRPLSHDDIEIRLFGYRLQLVRRMLASTNPTDRAAGRLLLDVAKAALLEHLSAGFGTPWNIARIETTPTTGHFSE